MSEETLTLLAFSDVHGRALEWDYLEDAPPSEPGSLSRISTMVNQIRLHSTACLLFDVGDTIQGTPMMALAARERAVPHPMSIALNHLGVDAACLGNHDLNFGLEHLSAYTRACEFPVLAANLTGLPGVGEWTLRRVPLGALGTVTVGVLGLTTPGSVIWDRPLLAGRVTADGIVPAAAGGVRALRAAGADVVVVLSHSGLGPSTSYGDALPWPENDTRALIRETAGIDAVFLGHKHVQEVGYESCTATGAAVPYVEPMYFGRRLGRIDLRLRRGTDGRVIVTGSTPQSLAVSGSEPDAAVHTLLGDAHDRTRQYVGRSIGVAAEAIRARPVVTGPSPAVDLVNMVQAAAVAEALTARGDSSRRVLAATALLGDHSGLPAGRLTLRELIRLYRFENLLQAVELTTGQLMAYLEHNALGFGGSDVPAYNVDSLGSADHDVFYMIDPAAPAGSRVSDLRIDGQPPAADERFVLALSSYRASGGGGFPATAGNPPVYDDHVEIRDLLVDWIRRRGTLHVADIRRGTWQVRPSSAQGTRRSHV